MKTIPLSQGLEALVDDEDFEELSRFKWSAQVGKTGAYAVRAIKMANGKQTLVRMHRQLLGIEGRVDHEDRNGLNNQRSNLRPATAQQNAFNTGLRRDNTTGTKGVYFEKRSQKWCGQIYAGRVFRERFATRPEAEAWVAEKRSQLHADFACDGT